MEKKFISDFKLNEAVDSVFILTKKNLRRTKHDKPYLELTLIDRTGSIEARLWEMAEKFDEAVQSGDAVRVKGVVDSYREQKQLKCDAIEKADEKSYRHEDMVRVLANRKELYGEAVLFLKKIKNPWVTLLAEKFTEDAELMSMFIDGIGAKAWHNAYIGGLVEHTYETMCIVDRVCDLYPEADRDIAIMGAFLHDIGKIFELDAKKMEYTIEGGLIGHVVIGHRVLAKKIAGIEGFPRDLGMHLEHIILSHHGEYEQQSPVLPKTLEATIVYQTDELMSQANAVKEIKLAQGAAGKVWSNFVPIKNRKYYIKGAEGQEKKSS